MNIVSSGHVERAFPCSWTKAHNSDGHPWTSI
jgi:hypothetical protein